MNRNLLAISLVTSVIAIAGCGGGSSTSTIVPPSGAPPSVQRTIAPKAINSQISEANEPHVIINPSPSVMATGKLFVFLAGTDGHPEMYRYIVQAGAARGYHTIGLNYPNPVAVGLLCGAELECYYQVRNEIITGEDTSNLTSVAPVDSIVERLKDAIAYLRSTFPDEGWGQYLRSDGNIDWAKIVLGGHSQGGGHVGVMVKKYLVARACYFASPPDWIASSSTPAPWVKLANVTPASRQYGFAHLQDDLVPFSEVAVIWRALGMEGGVVLVDSSAPPYGMSHLLSTNAMPNPESTALSPTHSAPVRDAATPLNSAGKPLFDPVWGYLCFQ